LILGYSAECGTRGAVRNTAEKGVLDMKDRKELKKYLKK